MRYLLFILSCVLFISSCGQPTAENTAGETKNLKRYDLRGKVVSVDRAAKKAEIDHEEIPGFMPRMTMSFPVKEDWVWEDLKPGVEIQATLVVDNAADEPYWLEKVAIVAAANPDDPAPPPVVPDATGKDVPPISFTNQDGKKIKLTDFKGKALAITFIYRECPLPDACIKMSRQFSDVALKLNDDEELKDKVRLLSISFDPERDSPAKLREYGIGYLGNPAKPDFTIWQLAVGGEKETREVADFFNLKYSVNEQNKAEINHNLVTAVISPDGKVDKMMPGNRWAADDLLLQLKLAVSE
ncbi:MAG: SCO family protein [Acidobacteria bacterium]|nr:SCO family protein [Acidobacteriota bacterium]